MYLPEDMFPARLASDSVQVRVRREEFRRDPDALRAPKLGWWGEGGRERAYRAKKRNRDINAEGQKRADRINFGKGSKKKY